MQFVAILLAVLKLLGLVIVSLLILIIFLLFLVLFIPITYNAKAGYIKNELIINAEAGWFFNFIHLIYNYSEKLFSIRICGFKLNTKKNKKNVKSEEVNTNKNDIDITNSNKIEETVLENTVYSNINKTNSDNITTTNNIESSSENITTTNNIESSPENTTTTNSMESSSENTTTTNSMESSSENTVTSNIKDSNDNNSFNKKIVEKDEDISDGTKASSCGKINKILDLLQSDSFKEAFSYSKNKINKLLKHLLPRKWNIYARLGFDDPSVTGKVMAIAGIIYPFTFKHIQIKGEFENNIIEVDSYFKGHITLIKIVLTGTLVYFNKNIRKIIKSFKEVM